MSPFQSHEFAFHASMSLRIEIVDPRPFYHPGDRIQGNVILDSKKSEDIAQVTVGFTGRCKVKIRRHDHYTTVRVYLVQGKAAELKLIRRSHIAHEATTSGSKIFSTKEATTPSRVVLEAGLSASQ
jgi:hypothetical protein